MLFIAIIMVVIFFVTSCDSGAMVVDMLCSFGNNNTPVWQRIYWTVGVGIVAAILLAAGGLNALQTMTIASALPFAIILLMAMVGLIKALRVENCKQQSQQLNSVPLQSGGNNEEWRQRLQNIIDFPNKSTVENYLHTVVHPAFESVAQELKSNQIEVDIVRSDGAITLQVKHTDEHDFIYGVHRRKHQQPDFANADPAAIDKNDEHSYYRAEVHLKEGGKDYDIMGWSSQAVINDVVNQYHKHLHFLHLLR